MYLIDSEIEQCLDILNISTDNPKFPFIPNEQIQPCSIDLRLSNVFWKPKKRNHKTSSIDLRSSALIELSPRMYWKKQTLSEMEYIKLKPNQFILGRIYEEFTVPHNCAGKIEGRSSFCRLGLMVHFSGDFINPGWRGHMPLQIINLNPNPIILYPYLPICQMSLIKLSETPKRLYGEKELQSKYMNDDGGPSYWWRDKRIERLHDYFKKTDISLAMTQEIISKLGVQDVEIIERFEHCIKNKKICNIENSDTILEQFTNQENKKEKLNKLIILSSKGIFPLLFSIDIPFFFIKTQTEFTFLFYIFITFTLISLPFFIWAIFNDEERKYLTTKKYNELQEE